MQHEHLTSSAEANEAAMLPVGRQQQSTRKRVFGAIGNTVGFGLDASAFVINLGAYGIGKTLLTVGTATKSAMRGITDKPFYRK